jgi:sporulation protein YlmC with PRC-barrel domain
VELKKLNLLTMENYDADNQTGKNHEGPRSNTPLKYLSATTIIGEKVYNVHDEKLGDIKDIMVDLDMGKITYVVLEMGGFLGIGEKYFAIPYPLFAVDTVKEAFILDQEKEALENAPGFDKDHWPETNSHYNDSANYWRDSVGSSTPYRQGV